MKSNIYSLVQESCGTFILPKELVNELFSESEIKAGEARLQVNFFGPWQIAVSARGLVIDFDHDKNKEDHCQPLTVYGKRTMTNWKQCGYEAEGKVSLNGKKRRVFTSSKLFRMPDGSLLSAGVLHLGREKEGKLA